MVVTGVRVLALLTRTYTRMRAFPSHSARRRQYHCNSATCCCPCHCYSARSRRHVATLPGSSSVAALLVLKRAFGVVTAAQRVCAGKSD